MHEFEELEDAAIAALTPLLTAGLKTLDAYSGQLDIEELDEITLRFPCIYVIASGLAVNERNIRDQYEMGLTLLVGDINFRSSKDAARGSISSPGVYELLKAARGYIHHKKLLAAWAPLVLQREAMIAYAPELSICLYQAEYKTKAMK